MPPIDKWEQAAPPSKRELSPEHLTLLTEESGIDPGIIEARGYYSPTATQIARMVALDLLHPNVQKASSWLAIPICRPDGVKHGEIIRQFGHKGKMKYVWPQGTRTAADVHPSFRELLLDADVPLIITEGTKKADAILSASIEEGIECVVLALSGCWAWKGKTGKGTVALPDFHDIALLGRRIIIVVDSDFRSNDNVRAGWSAFATYLSGKTGGGETSPEAGKPQLVIVPPSGLDKMGADDYLVAGGLLYDLMGLATTPYQAMLDEANESYRPFAPRTGKEVLAAATDFIPHLVTPLIPESAIVVVAGQSGTFKTWHCLSLCLDLVFGLHWLDHPDFKYSEIPVNTLYINKEMGGKVLDNRLKKLVNNPRYRDIPGYSDVLEERFFVLEDATLDMAQAVSRDRLEELIVSQDIRVVVLDSLSMCWSGDENSNSEVGVFYSQLRLLTERTGVIWIILHHTLKPSGMSKKDHIMFSIRGAGQIVQQADAAMILTPYNERQGDPDNRDVTIATAKSRTDKEPETFISTFKTNDGFFCSISYTTKLKEAKAVDYAKSSSNTAKLQEWLLATLVTWAAMKPTGPGMRSKQLMAMLRGSWPVEDKSPPSDAALAAALAGLRDSGQLEVIDESRRNGSLYRLPVEGVEITPAGGVKRGLVELPIRAGVTTMEDGTTIEVPGYVDDDDLDELDHTEYDDADD